MKATLIILSTVVLFLSCSKTEQYFNENIKVIGHGGIGNSSSLPMNTLESMLACYHSGANGNEMDVQMTSDGVLVAMHDLDLSEATNLQGMVNAMTWEELRQGYYTGVPFLNYKIVSLDQIFAAMAETDRSYLFTLDCKLYNDQTDRFNEKFTDRLIEIIHKYDLEDRVLLESQSESFLRLLHSKNAALRLFIYTGTAEEGILIGERNGFYGITISTRNITGEQIQKVQQRNLKVAIWNVQSKEENKEAVEKQADYIQTEKVAYLIDLLS